MAINDATHPLVKLNGDEQRMLDKVRALVVDQIGPQAQSVSQQDVFAWGTFKTLCDEGIVATGFPKECGGTNASMVLRVRIIEELASVCSTAASMITGTDLSSRPIVAGASESLKAEVMADLISGKKQSAFALTEPSAGSDVARLTTRYKVNGNGFELNGEKKFITRANVADMFVAVARLEDGPSGGKGLSAFLVPRNAPGVSVSNIIPKMGWNGVPIAMITFDKVQLPATCLLGKEGQGMMLAQDTLLRARIGHAAIALGRARGALQIAAQYASHRQVFGQAVGAHQGIQWMLADMTAQIEAARCLVYSTALRYDEQDKDVAVHASMAKMLATDLCMKVVVDCLQIMGGNGYLKAWPLERFMRDAKMNQIGEGTSEVHKNLIGRHVMTDAAAIAKHPCLDENFDPDLFNV
jgi:alkylation response protein AidB-like acyl-CoA dehydrogenase